MYNSGFQPLETLTLTLTHITARRNYSNIRAKYNQPFFAQSEVALAHPHLTLTLNLKYHLNRLPSPPQGHAPEVSGLHDITTKWQLHTRVSNPRTHTLSQRQRKTMHQHAQIRLPSRLRMLFLMLLTGMSLNSDSGVYKSTSQISHVPELCLV